LGNKKALVVTETWECLRKKWFENKMARVVTGTTDDQRETWFEN